MPTLGDTPTPSGRALNERRTGTWLVVAITLVSVAWPFFAVLWTIIAGVMGGDVARPPQPTGPEPALTLAPAWGLLASTALWALAIAVAATALAYPAAWLLRARGWIISPLLLTPLFLPNYLAFNGYSTIRAAGTTVGSWLEQLSQGPLPQAPSLAGKLLAAAGLALWAWPLAAVVLGAMVRRIDEHVLETLRLDARPWRKRLETLRLCRGGLVGAAGVVFLVMLGSAIPLHLAQVPTYAVKVWLDLTLDPGGWRVWLSAWPLILAALLGAWTLGGRALSAATSSSQPHDARPSAAGGTWLATAAVWGLSVVVPLVLFMSTVRGWKPYSDFWALSGRAILNSFGVAAAAGVVGVLLAAGCWQGVSSVRRGHAPTLLLWCVRGLLLMGLLPGVLVGSAVSIACNSTPGMWWLGDSAVVLVLVHVARFGFVGALIGVWLAAIEPQAERDLRSLDGALGLRGWVRACLPFQGGALVGAGLATAALSLHEIEAAVVVQPPGTPSLAQVMLNHLHQLRMQDVSAAAVSVVVVGLVVAGLAGAAGVRTLRQSQ